MISGTANINTGPGLVTIRQATTNAIINWQDFSIATGETTRFQVPNALSSTLNRVTGGNISNIYGTLQSNGRVFLINPNGVFVGPSGRIDTASFLASTLNLSDAQYLQQGDLNFAGTSNAAVTNQGKIRARSGDVYLIAAQVNNSGSISAKNGTVGLAAGTQVLLQKSGDQHLFVQVGNGSAAQHATGIVNSGNIAAAAAELKAAGGNAYALAINNSGNIAATGVKKINGQVYLTADGADITNSGMISAKQASGNGGTVVINAHSQNATTKGTLLNSSSVIASGTASGAVGGTVELLGDKVGLTAGLVDVSGDAGGGTALVGGDEHGANAAVPDADQTYMGPNAKIDADALSSGNGGKVILWGNSTTQAYGHISVRGGAQSGNGGFVETSGAKLQALTAPDLSAPNGKGGTWLLDPSDVTIDDQVSDSGFTTPPFTINSGASTVTVNQATLLTALQGGNVQIDASQGTGGGSTITWTQTGGTPFDFGSLSNDPTLDLFSIYSTTLSGVKIFSSTTTGGLNLVLATGAGNSQVSVLNSNINLGLSNGSSYLSMGTAGGIGNPASVSIVGSTLVANNIDVTSPNINVTSSTLSSTDGTSLAGFGSGQINISSSTFNLDGLLSIAPFPFPGVTDINQVTISNSTINLTGFSSQLDIQGGSITPGAAGVKISDSTIITDSGQIDINGTGLQSPGSDSIGVQLDNSTFTIGSASSATGASLDIKGYSDAGSTNLTANQTFANNAYGVKIDGSTFNSYTTDKIDISGNSYAADNLNTYGTYINGGSFTATGNDPLSGGKLEVDGDVYSEKFSGSSGEANDIYGIYLLGGANLSAAGGKTNISLLANTYDATASDNGNSSVKVINAGIDLTDGSTVSATGNNNGNYTSLDDLHGILFSAAAGMAVASNSNQNNADSIGVWIHSNGGATPVISGISDLIGISGYSEGVTAPYAISNGVALGDLVGGSAKITATNGGSVGLAGVGGTISAPAGATSFTGDDVGLDFQNSNVSTTTGFVLLGGLAGIVGGNRPADSAVNSAGVKLSSSTISTNTSGPGISISYNGGTTDGISYGGGTINLSPSIVLYGSNGGVDINNNLFVPGTGGYAVEEDANSSLVSENLVMGNPYGQLSNLVPASVLNQILSSGNVQNAITTLDTWISQYNVTVTPIGQISLASTSNQIANLDSVLVGSGGFNFYDNSSVTVDPIGGNDNTAGSYGDVNMPADGPVTITTTGNLILSNTSPLTGATSSTPVIWTTGAGNNIVLNVEDGYFINQAGSNALVGENGAFYAINSKGPKYAFLGGLDPTAYYNTVYITGVTPLTGNSIFYQSAYGSQYYPDGPGDPNNPFLPVATALNNLTPISLPAPISGAGVIGGAGGVAPPQGREQEVALRERLARQYGAARAEELLAIIEEDGKDGSTVNTGTILNKWAANTGLSKIVHVGENAQIYDGLSKPYNSAPHNVNADPIIQDFQQVNTPASLDDMNRAAAPTAGWNLKQNKKV